MSSIGDAARARLLADSTFAALAGTRVYPVLLPQNPANNSVTYQLINEVRGHSMEGAASPNPLLQFDCWSTTYSGANALADAISASLDGFRGTMGGLIYVSACLQIARRQDYEPESQDFRVSLDFSIWHN